MKKLIAIVLALVCMLAMAGCNTKSMHYIMDNKPKVIGIVREVYDDYVIMYSETAEGYPNGSNWSISLNVENKDSYTDIVVGDEIVVYYDGMVAETDPLRVGTVYAITLKTPADRTIIETIEETDTKSSEEIVVGGDLTPMVMVNDELYLDTGDENAEKALPGSEIMTDPVESVSIRNIFTGESANITGNEDVRTLSNILFVDSWNSEATTDCLSNIEIIINGTTYIYHSDCGTFNDNVNQRYLSLDDETANVVDTLLAKYISLTSTEIPAE